MTSPLFLRKGRKRMQEYLLFGACIIAGIILVVKMGKENKVFYPVGVLLVLIGGWVLANKQLDGMLSKGWYVWVARAVILVAAIWLIGVMVRESKKTKLLNESITSAEDIYDSAYDDEDDRDADQGGSLEESIDDSESEDRKDAEDD